MCDVESLRASGWSGYGVDKKTGTDLNTPHLFRGGPFDLVYSNYVLHFLRNKEQLFETAYNNLKDGGWFFVHTFHKTDENIKGFDESQIIRMLSKFVDTSTRIIELWDDEVRHKHWHVILEAVGKKPIM